MSERPPRSSSNRDNDAANEPPAGTVEPFKELTRKLIKVPPEKVRRALASEKAKKRDG